MALQGNIDSFSVVDVLRLLGSSAKSGRLVVDGDRGSGSLWLADGMVVAGTTTRIDAPTVPAPVTDVLFDLVRFDEGSFVFEAGVGPSGPTTAPIDVESMIAEVEVAMAEWDEIVAVVPSLASRVSLSVHLGTDTVEIDRRLWSGIVGIAAAVEAHGDRATVGTVAELAGLSELPALRLVRDLVRTGLAEVGPSSGDGGAHRAATATTPAFEPASFEPSSFEAPPAYDPAAVDLPEPLGSPFEVPAPIGNIGIPDASDVGESFAGFEPFDPFGTAGVAPLDSSLDAPLDSPLDAPFDGPFDAPAPVADLGTVPADAEPASAVTVDPGPSAEDEAAQQAEFARQLAMLSPRAAEAVASAEAGPTSEDDERARVARFLGSV